MTAERTPLAVLMTALGESMSGLPSPGATAVANTPNTLAQARLSQKKRKRTVACGHCDACGRDDCGRCLNCLDKPKFGGQGIRKQSCLERKCRFPTSAIVTSTSVSAGGPSSAAPKLAPAASATPPPPQTKAREEWDDFWGAVECCMRLQTNPQPSAAIAVDERGNKKARTARCGSCTGCVRGDCGECKNCLDKPKFGGRGIKKQACLQRVCCNPQEEDPDESPGARRHLKLVTHPAVGARGAARTGFVRRASISGPHPPHTPPHTHSLPPTLPLRPSNLPPLRVLAVAQARAQSSSQRRQRASAVPTPRPSWMQCARRHHHRAARVSRDCVRSHWPLPAAFSPSPSSHSPMPPSLRGSLTRWPNVQATHATPPSYHLPIPSYTSCPSPPPSLTTLPCHTSYLHAPAPQGRAHRRHVAAAARAARVLRR